MNPRPRTGPAGSKMSRDTGHLRRRPNVAEENIRDRQTQHRAHEEYFVAGNKLHTYLIRAMVMPRMAQTIEIIQ